MLRHLLSAVSSQALNFLPLEMYSPKDVHLMGKGAPRRTVAFLTFGMGYNNGYKSSYFRSASLFSVTLSHARLTPMFIPTSYYSNLATANAIDTSSKCPCKCFLKPPGLSVAHVLEMLRLPSRPRLLVGGSLAEAS